MASSNLLSLEAEVLANVLEYVDSESPRTTAAVAQTCKYLNYVAKLVRYRHITVRWDAGLQAWVDNSGRNQEEWETPELLQGLRQLTVCSGDLPTLLFSPGHDDSPTAPEHCKSFNRLETVLRNASNLKTLVWKVGYLPTEVLVETLQTHQPNAKMDIFRARRLTNADRPLASEKVLAAATCLNSFSMSTAHNTCTEDMLLFHMIVRSAPNLRFASILCYPPMDLESPIVNIRRRHLEIFWFPPDQPRKQSSSLRHLTLDGWEMSDHDLAYWSQYVNLGCLEGLKCSRSRRVDRSFFERAPQLLTNLKSFSINLRAGDLSDEFLAAANNYIATCPPLQILSLWSWRGKVPLSTILDRHGATLQDLQLHEDTDLPIGILRESLSVEEIQSIRQSCPGLRTFTFDLTRASPQLQIQDYQGILDELRRFSLDKIQIYIDPGLQWFRWRARLIRQGRVTQEVLGSAYDDPTIPLDDVCLPTGCSDNSQFEGASALTIDCVRHAGGSVYPFTLQPPSTHKAICSFLIKAWKTIFGSKTSGPRQLELKFGEWEKKFEPRRHDLPDSTRDIRVFCRARPHERDDMVGECFVEFDCCGGQHSRKFSSR
ncbi:uncharacterized protein PV07_11826 [Cladophialophora immunda]|uniref:F-box domain-containing protein n=1 Tax=Cladophialophora immunda TaxID=569365 RepID=A0A0D2AFJ3_9EURO|nr:uncharacterized protein PV07_11826 [Cladophialophora immunda]KIW23642.1 hypothetical protein PV07_11826 [Cladophialophora immunda]